MGLSLLVNWVRWPFVTATMVLTTLFSFGFVLVHLGVILATTNWEVPTLPAHTWWSQTFRDPKIVIPHLSPEIYLEIHQALASLELKLSVEKNDSSGSHPLLRGVDLLSQLSPEAGDWVFAVLCTQPLLWHAIGGLEQVLEQNQPDEASFHSFFEFFSLHQAGRLMKVYLSEFCKKAQALPLTEKVKTSFLHLTLDISI